MATHTINVTGTIPDNTFDPFGSASAAQAAAIAAAETDATTKANAAQAAAILAAASDATTKANAAQAAAIAASQPLDADLTAIAGLTPSNDDVIQRKAGSWVARTMAQLWADLQSFADALYQGKNTAVDTVAILPPSLVEWANMPSALTFFAGQNRWVVPMDLSGKVDLRMHVTTGSLPGSANAKIRLLYRTQTAGYSTTITDYTTVGTSEVQVTIGTSINTLFSTAWIPIIAGARDNVIVALAGLDGDGTADPRFLNVYLETR